MFTLLRFPACAMVQSSALHVEMLTARAINSDNPDEVRTLVQAARSSLDLLVARDADLHTGEGFSSSQRSSDLEVC
jgi:hypothetical protein